MVSDFHHSIPNSRVFKKKVNKGIDTMDHCAMMVV